MSSPPPPRGTWLSCGSNWKPRNDNTGRKSKQATMQDTSIESNEVEQQRRRQGPSVQLQRRNRPPPRSLLGPLALLLRRPLVPSPLPRILTPILRTIQIEWRDQLLLVGLSSLLHLARVFGFLPLTGSLIRHEILCARVVLPDSLRFGGGASSVDSLPVLTAGPSRQYHIEATVAKRN